MPKYKVQTDQGTYSVELSDEPASQEELMSLVQGAIASPESSKPASPTKARPEGFFATAGSEISGGVSDIAAGVKRALGIGQERTSGNLLTDPALGMAQTGMGALRLFPTNVLATAGGAKAGEMAQDTAMKLGAGPNLSAGIATAADLGTQLLLLPALIRRGIASVGSSLFKPSSIVQDIRETASKFDIPLTAAQLTQNRALSQLESLPGRFPIGVQPVYEFGKKQAVASKLAATEKIGEKISPVGLSTEEAGELFTKTLYQDASKTARAKVESAYDAVKQTIPSDALFDTSGIVKAAKEVERESILSKGIIKSKGERLAGKIEKTLAPDTQLLERLPPGIEKASPDAIKTIIDKYNLNDPERLMTFEGMDFLRKDLREALRTAKTAGKDQEVRRLGMLIDGLTDDMRQTAIKFPEAYQSLENADTLYKREIAPFFTKGTFPRKLSEQDASQFVKNYIWGNRDRPERIEIVKQAIGKPEEYNKIVRAWWTDLVEKSIDPKTETFSLDRMITNYNRFDPTVRESLLGPVTKDANELIDLFAKMKTAAIAGLNPSETARGLFGGIQILGAVKAATSLLAGNIPAVMREGILLLSPMAIGRIITSPGGIKLLSRQMQLPAGTPEAVESGARLLALANAGISKSDLGNMLRSRELSVEEKIDAATGRNGQIFPPDIRERLRRGLSPLPEGEG